LIAFGGRRANGSDFILSEIIAGGTGASSHADGVDCLQTDGSNGMNLPVEAIGIDNPIRVVRFGLRRDSGGAGRFRGGLGIVREYAFDADNIRFTFRGERHFTEPRGSLGGHAGCKSQTTLFRSDGRVESIASKCVTTVSRGDRLIVETAGGAGFGEPETRARAAVAADIANRKVSEHAAQTIYGYPP
jgi:N-methylhydantoinase B/oxoprolinase/acetone carboxylase alpha subunit